MSFTKHEYKISKMKQLIDLNGDLSQFEIEFKAYTPNEEQFDALVVTQDILDSGNELLYNKAPGVISGTVSSDSDIYQNYFLVLKSDVPCTCIVEIKKMNKVLQNNSPSNEETKENYPSDKQPNQNQMYMYILLTVVFIGGGLLLMYMYKRKNTQPIVSEISDTKPENNLLSRLRNMNLD